MSLDTDVKRVEAQAGATEGPNDPEKRNTLIKLGKWGLGLAVLTSGLYTAASALALPSDSYDPRDPRLSESNYKSIIAKHPTAWVQYTFTGSHMPQKFVDRGDVFWTTLKENFGSKVDAWIKIDFSWWPNGYNSRCPARAEVGSPDFPGFVLYQNGKIYVDKLGDKMQVQGPPVSKAQQKEFIAYIAKNTFLG